MAIRRFFLFPATLIIGVFLLASIPAQAQWTVLKSFTGQIECVYFLDQVGSPAIGFVALNNSTIWRTTDNGATWNQVNSPSTPTRSAATQFTFRNANQGWCSVRDVNFDVSGAIWETTDGGVNWTSVFGAGAFVSIAFCPNSNMLSAPCWSTSAYQSTDLGAHWTTFAPTRQNGVTFSGSNGVIGNLQAPNPLYSTDGGVSWNDAPSLYVETWSPLGLPGTNIFVAAAEKTRQFFISKNGGASWTNPYTFFQTPTGCIMGTVADLFVQTIDGSFYSSLDTGTTWISICGPANQRDTRFYTVGPQIYAGDVAGNLWYLPDAVAAGTVALHLDKTQLMFSGTRCVTLDSAIHITSSSGCVTGVLTKAQVISGGANFSLQGIALPHTLTGVDSIGVIYSPSPSLKDSGTILLEFNVGTRIVDTIITLYGTARNAASVSIQPSLILSTPYACVSKDSIVVIRNLACDTLTVIGISLSDSSHFQIPLQTLPLIIKPGGADTVAITSFSNQAGTFTSELELLMVGGGSVNIDDSVPLTLNVFKGGQADIRALNLSALDGCSVIDTAISISATPCDSITLLQASLNDSSIFRLGGILLPAILPPSGGVTVNVHITPGHKGNYFTRLHLRFLSGSATVDTTITLTLKVLYDIPGRVVLQDTLVQMGTVNVPCAASSRWITFSDGLCKNLVIKNIAWENADSTFSFDTLSLPITLSSNGGIDSLLLHFKPNAEDSVTNKLRITLDLDGSLIDTVLTVSGVGISSFHDSLLTPTLRFDTLLACQADTTLMGKLVNLSCDSIVATSATFSIGINYKLVSPTFPIAIAPGDTLNVVIQFQQGQSGNATDQAIVTIHDPVGGKDHIETILLDGFVIPNIHLLAVSSSAFSFSSIPACSSLDSSLVLTNLGNCEDIIISDTSLTGFSGVTFVPPISLPIVIHPDSTVRLPFHVVPTSNTIASTELLLRGQNIDTVVSFLYSSLAGGNVLAFSLPDSVFVTKPCAPITKTFWVANVGCDPTLVDTIALFQLPAETQFTLGSLPSFPFALPSGDTLFYTVQFDPNGNGNGVASLNVRSGQVNYNRSIALSGSAVGIIPTARIAIESGNGTMQTAGVASDTTDVAAVLLDDIGDTTGPQSVSLTIDANWNLLTLTKLVPAPGWSLADSDWQSNGSLALRIHHDVGGAVAAGTELVQCYFAIAVTDSSGCDIGMSGLRFDDSSATYDGCVLTSVEMPGAVRFSFIDTCGTSILRSLLEGQLALRIISICPNPVSLSGGTGHLELCIALARAGTVAIVFSDMLGRERWRTNVACSAGTQTLSLTLPNMPEGNGFIEVSSGGVKDSRNVSFESGIEKN